MPDTRFQPYCVYEARFLFWWGLLLFLCKLGRLRQLDYDLRDLDTEVLDNVNALARTRQKTLPVSKTLSHFLTHVGAQGLRGFLAVMVRRLIRNKVLDAWRVEGALVVALDGTGIASFRRRHCPYCLTQTQNGRTSYFHEVLSGQFVTASGLTLPVASAFIDNRDERFPGAHRTDTGKQDCELKAFARLAPELKQILPQTRLCLTLDSLYACGSVMAVCEQNHWRYLAVFKEGCLPALWREFQAQLQLCPEDVRLQPLPDGTRLEHRWINGLVHIDSERREHRVNALLCREIGPEEPRRFAWVTNIPVTVENVIDLAMKGGRHRWKIENSFNMQKNGGYNLEHVYGAEQELLKCYYVLLQIAHLILQLVEKGSLLRRAAQQHGGTVLSVYGSLRNIARRLLDCLRYRRIPDEALNPTRRIQIRLDGL